jgi:hypothetical protein
MSKALICSVALAALVASGVVLQAADVRIPSGRDIRGGDRDRGGESTRATSGPRLRIARGDIPRSAMRFWKMHLL